MARIFIRRDREAPTATTLPKGKVNQDMIARIEAYTRSPFADDGAGRDPVRFQRLQHPALLRTGL
jgi:hypothetical protein